MVVSSGALTGDDAREVLKEHFGNSAIGSVRVEDNLFTVWGDGEGAYARPPSMEDGRKKDSCGRSPQSWEAALHDLEARRPDLLKVPLTDPDGVFKRLQKLRSPDGSLLYIEGVPITAAQSLRLERLGTELPAIRSRLKPRVSAADAPQGAFALVAFTQAMLHRTVLLVDGVIREWNGMSAVTTAILSRCVLETIAVWSEVLSTVEHALDRGEEDGGFDVFMRAFFGSKLKVQRFIDFKPIHVLEALRGLDRLAPGIMDTYDRLSEVCHPNAASIHVIMDFMGVGGLEFSPSGDPEHVLELVLEALRLDLAEANLARSAALAARVEALAQEAGEVG